MMRLFFVRLWFMFVPLLLYVGWMLWRRRQARLRGAAVPAFTDGPWALAVAASMLLGAAGLAWIGVTAEPEQGPYTPPHLEGDVIVPGKVE